jgi:hypothetical protein
MIFSSIHGHQSGCITTVLHLSYSFRQKCSKLDTALASQRQIRIQLSTCPNPDPSQYKLKTKFAEFLQKLYIKNLQNIPSFLHANNAECIFIVRKVNF